MNTQPRTPLVTPGLRAPGADILPGLGLNQVSALPTAEGKIGFEEFPDEDLDERFPGRAGGD